jgi:hypothetical protein
MSQRLNPLFAMLLTSIIISLASPAKAAVFLGNIYVTGANNTFEDQDREALIDRSPTGDTPDGVFGVGDVLLGFARLDDHTQPAGAFGDLGNRVYGIFSQQVVDVNGTGTGPYEVIFDATTVPGLTLSAITGLTLPAEGIAAVFDRTTPFPTDLINVSPGDVNGSGGAPNLWDYFAEIVGNAGPVPQPSLVAGIGNAGGAVLTTVGAGTIPDPAAFAPLPDHFIARTTPLGSALITGTLPLALLPTLQTSETIVNFEAGLSILLNNDPDVIYNRRVSATETVLSPLFSGPVIRHDLSITRGTVGGVAGDTTASPPGPPAVNASEWTETNPDSPYSNPGGFITDADFVVNPTVIPEPGSILVFAGLFSIGCIVASRSRMNRSACDS